MVPDGAPEMGAEAANSSPHSRHAVTKHQPNPRHVILPHVSAMGQGITFAFKTRQLRESHLIQYLLSKCLKSASSKRTTIRTWARQRPRGDLLLL